ncbi:MAG: hypothetical protein LKF37_05240, partial [Lentilactobacillus diolivorans]|nr:hypothetical protein [Lentilactobacillus diolivorans]
TPKYKPPNLDIPDFGILRLGGLYGRGLLAGPRFSQVRSSTRYSEFWNIKSGGLYGRGLLAGPRFG